MSRADPSPRWAQSPWVLTGVPTASAAPSQHLGWRDWLGEDFLSRTQDDPILKLSEITGSLLPGKPRPSHGLPPLGGPSGVTAGSCSSDSLEMSQQGRATPGQYWGC